MCTNRKACSSCFKTDWWEGELYFTDLVQPWGADKLCEGCMEGWLAERYGVEEDEEGEEKEE